MMSKFIRAGAALNVASEASSPFGSNMGPHVGSGTNDMYFDGNTNSVSGDISFEPWGPSMDGGTVFTHEMGHTSATYNFSDPLNVAHTENLYRAWNGLHARNDYGVLNNPSIPVYSIPVPNRTLGQNLIYSY